MTIIYAMILGAVQGLAEFLPISSSGHLVLGHALFGGFAMDEVAFDLVLHFATAAAVIVYFRKDLLALIFSFLRLLGRLPVHKKDKVLMLALVLGTIPGALAGMFFEDVIAAYFRSPFSVAVVLIIGSIFFIFAERRHAQFARHKSLTVRSGIYIGLMQCLALIPGFSRSGSTIGGGMLFGLSREDAARFSFLLALPIILGGAAVQFIKMSSGEVVLGEGSVSYLIAGGIVSFLVGLASIRFMLSYVRTRSLYAFVWYRIILAIIIFITILA